MSDSELTRWPGSPWPLLERGQRITVTHGGFTREFLVTDITPNGDGGETYTLKPAAEVDAIISRAADLVMDDIGPGATRALDRAIEDIRAAYARTGEHLGRVSEEDHG
jgi:hypothetical protein